MRPQEYISTVWVDIDGLDPEILHANYFALGNFYDSNLQLGLSPLPSIEPIEVTEDSILSNKPAFKNLDFDGVQFLRSLNFNNEKASEITEWAETLMRFLEINLSVLKKKCNNTFGSVSKGREVLLELTAFLMDNYYSRNDLRYLNIVLKLMDQIWLYSLDTKRIFSKKKNNSVYTNLLKIRLWIMREAALKKIANGAEIA